VRYSPGDFDFMACLLPLWAREHSNKPTHGQFKKTAKFPFFYQSREIQSLIQIYSSELKTLLTNLRKTGAVVGFDADYREDWSKIGLQGVFIFL
jgi:hypothetical protein